MRSIPLMIWTRLKMFAKGFMMYLAIASIFGFSCFILEESQQIIMFGTWQSIPVEEWTLVKKSIDTMEKARTAMLTINNIGGWLNPFGYVSYRIYGEAERLYIDSLKARTFANAPHLFDSESVTFTFKPFEKEYTGEHWIMKNNRITVLSTNDFDSQLITGIVKKKDNRIEIDIRKSKEAQ